MAIDKIDILMLNMSAYTDWQHGIANRNMYVLHALLMDERVRKVVAVDYLPFTRKRAFRQWGQNVLAGVEGKVLARSFLNKLTAVRGSEVERTGFKIPRLGSDDISYDLFVYSDVRSVRREERVWRELKKELDRLDMKHVIVWSYLPTFVSHYGKFGEALNVFDAVDNWTEHSSYRKIRERLKLNYQTISAKADLIFTTSADLAKLFDRPDGVTFVPNGVYVPEIAQAPKLTGRDIAQLRRPIIGYIGTIQEDRFDVPLFKYLAEANPQKSFVLVGPVWPGIGKRVDKELRPLPNVHFLGRKSHLDRPAYLNEFAVAVIPHLQNDFNRHTNPMKLYEYLAAGKPVVTTPGGGVEAFTGAVHVASSPEDFNREILQALEEHSPEQIAARQKLAAEHSWERRVNVMLDQVFAKLNIHEG